MKILIIEDESAAARRLQKLIHEVDDQIEILDHIESIEAAVEWFQNHTAPDLVFMDIHLADGACFEIFNQIEINCPIVFATAYDQYALQAFKVNAVDYLLKPIKKEELVQALEKYKKVNQVSVDYQKMLGALYAKSAAPTRRLLIRFGQSIKVVDFEEVAYFYTQDKITFLITKLGKRYPVDHSIDKLEEMCDPNSFFRINRQFIINIEAIREMYAYSKSRVKIELQPACDLETIVSTERSSKFKKWLEGDGMA